MRIIKSLGASLVTFYFIGVFFSQLTFNPYKWLIFTLPMQKAIFFELLAFLLIVILFATFYLEVFNEEVD